MKLACDITIEECEVIDEAAKIENRTRANFVRTSCKERAERIIKEHEEKQEDSG